MNLPLNNFSNPENNVEQKQLKTSINSIAFIDTTVPDYQTLIAAINPEFEIVLLDSTRDGVEQISSILANRNKLTSVHIISHGRDGAAQLGTAQLSLNNLDKYTNQLQQWKSALTKGADILLYGCDIAAGDAGKAFVQRLGEITQADVAASDDLTGNKLLGGDWELEVQTGQIKAPLLLSQKAQEAFLALLNTQQTKLIASDGAGNDWFGNSVAISSDGNTALVGSRLDDTGSNSNQGSAYIFKLNVTAILRSLGLD